MCRVYIYDNCLILQCCWDWSFSVLTKSCIVLSVSTTGYVKAVLGEAVSMGDIKGTVCIVCNPKVILDIVNIWITVCFFNNSVREQLGFIYLLFPLNPKVVSTFFWYKKNNYTLIVHLIILSICVILRIKCRHEKVKDDFKVSFYLLIQKMLYKTKSKGKENWNLKSKNSKGKDWTHIKVQRYHDKGQEKDWDLNRNAKQVRNERRK